VGAPDTQTIADAALAMIEILDVSNDDIACTAELLVRPKRSEVPVLRELCVAVRELTPP
jgi:hypothetical protein